MTCINHLFADSETLCAPIQDARSVGQFLHKRVTDIEQLGQPIDSAIRELQHAVIGELTR